VISTNFPQSRMLSVDAAIDLLAELPTVAIAGGSVYDALVGAAAREHRLPLATRDRRASETYRALGLEVEIVGGPS
jgi:predicted nucleic acid-binding protein